MTTTSTFDTIFAYATPVLIGAGAIEALVLSLAQRRAYDWRAFAASLGDLLGRQYIVNVYLPSLAAVAIAWAWQHRVGTVKLDSVAAIALLFLGEEFCYYWFHRASHRMRWFWATHAVHHSPNEMNLSVAFRLGWTSRLTGASIFYAPLVWIGFPPDAVFTTLAINLLYQFWLHNEWTPKLGWLEHVLNTPSHHRVHHGANPEYLDANYGGVLIVFDRLFGTLVRERDDIATRYGLVTPLRSHNTFVIAFHEWANLARDVRRARSWRARIGIVLGPPGWRPRGEPAAEVGAAAI